MKMKLGLSAAAAGALFYAGSALAIPTVTIDGITVPVGIIPGGNQIQSGILDETAVGAVGDTLSGIGIVNTIRQGLVSTWNDGDNGKELAFSFTGFKVTAISSTAVSFSGGTVGFYVLAAGTDISAGGSIAADQAIVQGGTLWLSEKGAIEDALGNTLLSTIDSGSALTSIFAGHGDAFFDVTGGDAAGIYKTGTFANPFDVANGGASDQSFTSDFSAGSCTGGFQVCGSGTIKANAAAPTPEPMTIGLFGAGLAALGMARRKNRS
jgi:hypothetical protein